MPTANGMRLSRAIITMARLGNWSGELYVDSDTKLTGSVSLDIDGQAFKCFADPVLSGVFAGTSQARVVGGNGGLGKELAPKSYANGPSLQQVLVDILRECGETLASDADPSVLAKRFGKWHRERGPALRAIEALTYVAGVDWRVKADGTVWVGVDAYPEQKLVYQLVNEDWAHGTITIDPAKPELRPGVTFSGLRVEEVRHYLSPGGLRSEASAVSMAGHFRRLLGEAYQRIDYSRKWPARVSKQNGDGTLQVVLDDAVIKSPGIDRVPIRSGIPAKVKVPAGTRIQVGFSGGDPSRPYAEGWEGDAALEVAIAGGKLPAGRQGDMVAVTIPPGSFLIAAQAGVPNPAPVTVYGVITSGNPAILE